MGEAGQPDLGIQSRHRHELPPPRRAGAGSARRSRALCQREAVGEAVNAPASAKASEPAEKVDMRRRRAKCGRPVASHVAPGLRGTSHRMRAQVYWPSPVACLPFPAPASTWSRGLSAPRDPWTRAPAGPKSLILRDNFPGVQSCVTKVAQRVNARGIIPLLHILAGSRACTTLRASHTLGAPR